MLAATFLPTYDVSDGVGAVVDASADATWRALLDADLMEVGRRRPLAGALGAVRMAPELLGQLLRGAPPPRPQRMTLLDTAAMSSSGGGWVLLGRDDEAREIALGLVGRFWRPVIDYADLSADGFRDFAEPGWAKTVYALAVQPLEEHRSFVSAEMRTATTDERSRRWFRRYWTLGVGSGAHVLVAGLLDLVRETAEAGRTAVA